MKDIIRWTTNEGRDFASREEAKQMEAMENVLKSRQCYGKIEIKNPEQLLDLFLDLKDELSKP